MSVWGQLRLRFRGLLHLDDPPWRIALALAVGVFISCTPFYFFQTLLAVLVAIVFRLNKAATVAGTWLNLPWLQPFVYAASLKVGTLIVPEASAAAETLHVVLQQPGAFSWNELVELAQGMSVALFVGTSLVGVVAALATYVVALRVISARRSRRGTTSADRRAA
jgi:hypothetical protein